MNIFITTSNSYYAKSRDFNAWCARKFGRFDKVFVFNNETDIDDSFLEKNKKILSNPKGAGLWLWKSYFIHKALMDCCEEGDILFYLDAAAFFYRSASSVIQSMKDDIYAVQLPYIEEEFTKKEVFEKLNVYEERYYRSRQFQASYMAIRKNERTVRFVKEWLSLCQRYDLIIPDASPEIQSPGFLAHRMDQSLFSLLCKRYGVISGPEITQYSRWGYPYILGCSYLPTKNKKPKSVVFLHRVSNIKSINGILHALYDYCCYIKRHRLIPTQPFYAYK